MYKDEDISLIVRQNKKSKFLNKIFVFGVLVIVVISSASISGVMIASSHNKEILKQKKLMVNEISNITEPVVEEEQNIVEENISNEVKDNEKKPLIPIYSEDAKNRMDNIYEGDGKGKVAYLTFDDGPSSNITPQILNTLEQEGIKATFFVLGSRVELYPELVKKEYESGHYIANHGYSHVYKDIYSSTKAVLDEYNRTEKAIKKAIGVEEYSSHLFRFPGGSQGGKYANLKNEAKKVLKENDIAYVNWNALTRDAEGTPTAESILNDLKSTVGEKEKVVVLMHDTGSKQLTADTLSEVILYLRNQGYEFRNFYDIMY